MFKTLSAKLTVVLLVVFCAIGVGFILATEHMLEGKRLIELTTSLVVSAIAFSLLAALIVFNVLTRRLRRLAQAMDSFRESGFTRPTPIEAPPRGGDEIDRMATTFQEISERIARQIKQLEHVDEQRRLLLANVSHDLRTPLASIQGYLETLVLKRGKLSLEEERNYLEIAVRHSQHLGKLVGDLIELTKLEAREITPQPEIFSLAELAQDVTQKFHPGAQKRGLRLDTQLAPGLPPVDADIGMMERVFENLIENAMRNTPPGGHIRVALEPAGGRVKVRVTDTGVGIPHDELGSVFERYYRANRGEAADAGGTGLDLAITHHLVTLHGGNIAVESRLGAGTTFTFDLPKAIEVLPARSA